MARSFACCPYVRGMLVFLTGIVVGMCVQSWPAAGDSAAAQEKPAGSAEERVRQLKLELPAVTKPVNTYVSAVRVGDMLYVSGTGPGEVNGKPIVGRLGQDLNVLEGQAAARQVGLHVLSIVKAELGNLDKVKRVVKTLGMVNATPDFKQHPQVMNGFSNLMVDVFGEKAGKGARSSVGMSSLPGGIPVEIEVVFQVK
jgi:enamine deaminase RidA (YjgF/YER057c/UK114 family)